MAKLLLLGALLAIQGESFEDMKTTGVINCVVDTTIESPADVSAKISGELDQTAGPFQGHVEGNVWPQLGEAQRSLTLSRGVGPLACTLKNNADWPLNPTATFRGAGTKKLGDLGTFKYSVSSPVSAAWPPKLTAEMPSGTVEWEKNIGGLDCHLKSDSIFSAKRVGDLEVNKNIRGFECALRAPVQFDAESGLQVDEPTAVISRSEETDFGTVRGELETSLESPEKMTGSFSLSKELDLGTVCGELKTSLESPEEMSGSLSWSKDIGVVCCNVEAKSTGAIRCSLKHAVSTDALDALEKFNPFAEETTAPPAKWYDSLPFVGKGERLDEVSPNILSAPAVAFIGMLVGSGVTFAVFSWFGSSSRVLQAPLL